VVCLIDFDDDDWLVDVVVVQVGVGDVPEERGAQGSRHWYEDSVFFVVLLRSR
jgi:hypothetical protein